MENKIKEYRQKEGMTQKEAAAAAGIALSTYSNYEACRAIPPVDVAFRLAAVLGCTVEALFCMEKDRRPLTVETVAVMAMQLIHYADFAKLDDDSNLVLTFNSHAFTDFLQNVIQIMQLLDNQAITQEMFNVWCFSAVEKLAAGVKDGGKESIPFWEPKSSL